MDSPIRQYLVRLESRLAPIVPSDELHALLTETESHLVERTMEFEEVGLDRPMAELRAVQAFGSEEEMAGEVQPRPIPVPPPAPAPASILTIHPALRILAVTGALAIMAIAVPGWFVPFAIAAAVSGLIVFGTGAARRVVPWRPLLGIVVVSAILGGLVFGATRIDATSNFGIGTPTEPEARRMLDTMMNVERPAITQALNDVQRARAAAAKATVVRRNGRILVPDYFNGVMEADVTVEDGLRRWYDTGDFAQTQLIRRAMEQAEQVQRLQAGLSARPAQRVQAGLVMGAAYGVFAMLLVFGLQLLGSLVGDAFRAISRRLPFMPRSMV